MVKHKTTRETGVGGSTATLRGKKPEVVVKEGSMTTPRPPLLSQANGGQGRTASQPSRKLVVEARAGPSYGLHSTLEDPGSDPVQECASRILIRALETKRLVELQPVNQTLTPVPPSS